jgi:tetratricopeptide (TPR) repeat protein
VRLFEDSAPLEELLALLAHEAEATPDPHKKADLYVRLALLCWDLFQDADAAARYAQLAQADDASHPLVGRILLWQALSDSDVAALTRAESALRAMDPQGSGAGVREGLFATLADAWLFRAGDAARAAGLWRDLVAHNSGGAAQESLSLALLLAGDFGELATQLASAAPGEETALPHARLEAAHVLHDFLGDSSAAAGILEQVRARDPQGEDAGYALEHLLEIAHASSDRQAGTASAGTLLRSKVALLEQKAGVAHPLACRERQASCFLLAEELERQGAKDEAAALWTHLSADPAATFGATLALHLRRRLAVGRAAWEEAVEATCLLSAGTSHSFLQRAYLRRAAELCSSRAGKEERAVELYLQLFAGHAADVVTARALARLFFHRGEWGRLADHLEAQARHRGSAATFRQAAALAESRLGDVDRALRLCKDAPAPEGDLAACEELGRLSRKKNDRLGLSRAYRVAAERAADARLSGAYLCAAGVLDLAAGRVREAEEALTLAGQRVTGDVCAKAALALMYRQGARWRELCGTLEALATLAAHDAMKAQALRELGGTTALRLGDAKAGRAFLERALELVPEDIAALHMLAELAGEGGDWQSAVLLRERAVVASGQSGRAAALLLEIGDIEERHRHDDAAARSAYQRALAIDDRLIEGLRALANLHRKARRYDLLLHVLRQELELSSEPPRRLTLLLEISRHADQVEGDTRLAIECCRAALAIEADNATALAGLERLCKKIGEWALLAEVLRGMPRTQKNLRTLGEALENAERWEELAKVRKEELELTGDPMEAARVAFLLAQLHEERLGDIDGAAASYRRVLELVPEDARPLYALERIYEKHARWEELAEILGRELALLAEGTDKVRRVALLMRLGSLRQEKLGRLASAAEAYEAVLELDDKDLGALVALEEAYGNLGREGDLCRILERKAQATDDLAARAEMYLRLAELRDKRGDTDAALLAYREAFLADPANRNTFTALERMCYKREKWREVMELYDTAIKLVEDSQSRAYRLGDLYARRGQIQLQYLGQPGEAAASYLKVIELDPENDTSLRFLESIFSQQSDWTGLIRAYEKRAELTQDDDRRLETLRRAARVAAAKSKDMAEAARLYERILTVDPADTEALDALDRYHEKARDWEKLVAVLSMRLKTAGAGDAAVGMLVRIAQICEEGLRDETRAIEHYRRILEIVPGNKEALDALGRIYESTEKWADFIDVTRRQIRVTTDRNIKALLYFKCGSVMESKFSKEEDAIRYYDAAIKTSPSCLPAVHGVRDLHLRRKDWQRVIQTLELEVKLWQDDKERAGVFAQIGQVYADHLQDHDRALSYYENALSVDAECLPANRALFELYFAQKDWTHAAPLAVALAQKAMREGDPSERSEFYRKRGIVSRHAGDSRAAAESFIIALEIKPDHQAALDELVKLGRDAPEAYDFAATYRELEKIYRKREASGPFLARVLIAQASVVERSGDLDTAERMYGEALSLSPGDLTILLSSVELDASMRRYAKATQSIQAFLDGQPDAPGEVRVRALLRLSELHSEGEMDPSQAARVLEEILRLQPAHQEALYRLAQELYVLGKFAEAKKNVERVIELAAAPGAHLSPPALARYYYYLGRILEAMGEGGKAGAPYRRAAEYDPGYAPPALALAKRAAQQGDHRAADTTLIQAAHAAMESGGPSAAVPLQRGLARILLSAGRRDEAIEAYRGILAVEPDGAEDRVALAEIYAMDDLAKAASELYRVLERNLRHAPAYRLLATLLDRMNEPERAYRVVSTLELLGYAEPDERSQLATSRRLRVFHPRRVPLTDELRSTLLLPLAARSVLTEVYSLVAAELNGLYPLPAPGTNHTPHTQVAGLGLEGLIADTSRVFGVSPDVYVGDDVHGGMVVLHVPRPIVLLDRSVGKLSEAERRFLLGRAFESVRGGYAHLLRLGPRERLEVTGLLRALMMSEKERPPPAQEFVKALPKKTVKVLERFHNVSVGAHAEGGSPSNPSSDSGWCVGQAEAQDHAGLLCCDDFGAAAGALMWLGGEELAQTRTSEGVLALGAIPDAAGLVRYFLSQEYHVLHRSLGDPATQATS